MGSADDPAGILKFFDVNLEVVRVENVGKPIFEELW